MASAHYRSRPRHYFQSLKAISWSGRESKMRVALLSLHYAEYSSRLAIALSARHEVLLILDSANSQHELSSSLREVVVKSQQVRWFPRQRRFNAPFQLPKLVWMLRKFRPDVVH